MVESPFWYCRLGGAGSGMQRFRPATRPRRPRRPSVVPSADARKAILSATPAASDVPPHLHGVSVQSGKGPPWLEVSEAFSELVKKAACVWPLADVEASDRFLLRHEPWLAGWARLPPYFSF